MDHDQQEPNRSARSFWRTRYAVGMLLFAAIALFFLLSEHRAHTLSALPFLLLAACPILHIFMHGGHGHGSREQGKSPSENRAADTDTRHGRAQTTHRH